MDNSEDILNEGVREIAPGITEEKMHPLYIAPRLLVQAPDKIYQVNSAGHRYYYTYDENGNPKFYVSVTTMIKQTMPTSPFLVKWVAEMGYEAAQAYTADRAAYGTFMHGQIAEILLTGEYNLDALPEKLKNYVEANRLPNEFMNYADELKKDLLAFCQFAIDVELEPLAIEITLTHPRDGYAGMIDLPCKLNIEESGYFGEVYKTGANAGQPKLSKRTRRVTAIIDFKSGRKGFYEEHEIQLCAYRELWNEHFGDTPIEKLFNWSPKDWRGKKPTYNLKDQTDSPNAYKLPHLVSIARIEDNKRDNTVIVCGGKINLKEKPDFADNIQMLSLSEIITAKNKAKSDAESDEKPTEISEGERTPESNTDDKPKARKSGRKPKNEKAEPKTKKTKSNGKAKNVGTKRGRKKNDL